jgi:uncharacterized protein
LAQSARQAASEEVRMASSMHGWLLIVLMTATLTLYHFRHQWPLYLFIPLGAYVLIALSIRRMRYTAPRIEIGSLDRDVLGLTVVAALGSSALFVVVCKAYHVSFIGFAQQLPRWNPVLLIIICLLGSFINSCLEELIWRGIVYGAFAARMAIGLAIFLQALGFSFEHMFFIPLQSLGMCLAFVFGMILGWLRHRTGGLGAPILAHYAMDLTLMGWVLTYRL